MKKPAPCPHGGNYTAQHCTQCELDALRALLLAELDESRASATAWCRKALHEADARIHAERMADLKVNAYRAEFEKAIDDGRLSYGKSAKQWLSQLRAIKLQVHAMVDKFIGNPSQGRLVAIPPDLHSLVLLVDMVWLPNDTVDTVIDMDADAVALPTGAHVDD